MQDQKPYFDIARITPSPNNLKLIYSGISYLDPCKDIVFSGKNNYESYGIIGGPVSSNIESPKKNFSLKNQTSTPITSLSPIPSNNESPKLKKNFPILTHSV